MKNFRCSLLFAMSMASILWLHAEGFGTPLGNSFEYQGRLTDNGAPANGTYDFRFTLYDAATGGSMLGVPFHTPGVAVTGGLYHVVLTFPASSFFDQARFLEVAVGPQGGTVTALSPRRPMLATPQSSFALNADTLDGVNSSSFSQTSHAHSTLSATDGTPAVALTTNAFGDVGIGTATPQATLDVVSDGIPRSIVQLGSVTDDNLGGAGTGLDSPQGVAFDGVYAYVVSGGTGLDDAFSIFDVTIPASPVQVGILRDDSTGGTVQFMNNPNSVAINGHYAYVTTGENSLLTIDVKDPANPVVTSTLRAGVGGVLGLNGARYVAVSASRAYVVSQFGDSLAVYDLSDPASPVEVGIIRDNGLSGGTATDLDAPENVFVVGTKCYVVSNGSASLTIISVSNPATPVQLGVIRDDSAGGTATGIGGPHAVSVSGNFAYVVSGSEDSLSVIDVSNPATPVEVAVRRDGVGGVSTLNGASNVSIMGNEAVVVSSVDDAMTIFNISEPTNPVLSRSISNSATNILDGAVGLAVFGNMAVVAASLDDGIGVFSTGSPIALKVKGLATKDTGSLWTVFSDKRLKEDIAPIDNALTQINALHPVWFHYSRNWERAFGTKAPPQLQAGFVAQEYQDVFPDDVHTDPYSGYLLMDPSATLPHVVGAVQELDRKLESENEELKEQIEALKAEVKALREGLVAIK